MTDYKWIRVTKKNPCSVCGRPDWCTFSPELRLVCCMRIESQKPSKNSMGGYLHKLDGERKNFQVRQTREEIPVPTEKMSALYHSWEPLTTTGKICAVADGLGVSPTALDCLGWRWTGYAWAIPMHSPEMKIVGIRLRQHEKKWSIKGSHQGLFLPHKWSVAVNERVAMITEGPTDAAAALTLQFFPVGRPSCSSAEGMIVKFLHLRKIQKVVIVSDNDEAGIRGAEKLQKLLRVPSVLWVPQQKDLREFLRAGGTRSMIETQLKDVVWKTNLSNSRSYTHQSKEVV